MEPALGRQLDVGAGGDDAARVKDLETGPRDSHYLFERFVGMMERTGGLTLN